MADTLLTLDIVQNVGQSIINNAALYGANIIYLTREGVGMVQSSSGTPPTNRDFTFRTTAGILAFKIVFSEVATTQQNIHIIYKIP